MDRVKQFKKVQKEGLRLFKKKNKDYGDAFASHGIVGVLIRMGDKIKRAQSITQNGVTMTNTESLRDTLIDLHNYAGMALMIWDENNSFRPKILPPPPNGMLPPPPPPMNGRMPPPPPKCNIPPPPLSSVPLYGITPPPSPTYNRLRRYNQFQNNKMQYRIGQTVEIYSEHKPPGKVYKAVIKTIPRDRKMQVELDDGTVLYLNYWALQLKQSRAKRYHQENPNPLEKKWYLS